MTAYYNEIDPYAAEWLRDMSASNCTCVGEPVNFRSLALGGDWSQFHLAMVHSLIQKFTLNAKYTDALAHFLQAKINRRAVELDHGLHHAVRKFEFSKRSFYISTEVVHCVAQCEQCTNCRVGAHLVRRYDLKCIHHVLHKLVRVSHTQMHIASLGLSKRFRYLHSVVPGSVCHCQDCVVSAQRSEPVSIFNALQSGGGLLFSDEVGKCYRPNRANRLNPRSPLDFTQVLREAPQKEVDQHPKPDMQGKSKWRIKKLENDFHLEILA
jgi:hypothetical protein